MNTQYVADMSAWKPWQREYRFGVLLIIPPDPARSAVNALRARYAWSQSCECDAHISLTVPLREGVTPGQWAELQEIASGVRPFAIEYGPLKHYLPHPGVCLEIEPQAELDSLRVAIEGASCFKGAPSQKYPFSAHMTIAEMISIAQTQSIMEELREVAPSGTFVCTAVSYVAPDAGFRFTERGRLKMGR